MFPPVDSTNERQKAIRPQSIKRFPKENCQYLMNIFRNLSRENSLRSKKLAMYSHNLNSQDLTYDIQVASQAKAALTSQKIASGWASM
jgi:hypothetical protein